MSNKYRFPFLLSICLMIAMLIFSALPLRAASAQSATLTFTPTADAYVIEQYPTTNYGTATTIRVDSTPVTRSYLRFAVSGLNGAAVQSAKLRIYANSSNSTGYTVNALADNTWTESGLTYSNAPAPGSALKTSPAITAGQWVEADITGYITGDGAYNLALTTTSATNTSLAARESGANAPQLVIVTTVSATATPAAPTATKPASTATNLPPTATQPAPVATQPAAPTATNPPAATVTSAPGFTSTFKASADTYVASQSSNNNYGTSSSLRVDGSPVLRSYLRFNVSGLNGAAVQSAKLRVYANSSNSAGVSVNALSNNTWTESGLTYSNAPTPGSAIRTSAAFTGGQWFETDITGYVTGDGVYSLVLLPKDNTNTSFAARETGANAAQLVITTGTAVPTTVPTATSVPSSPTPTKVVPTATSVLPSATPTTVLPSPTPTATSAAGLTKVTLTKGPELIYTGSTTSMKIFWQWTANTSFRVDWGTTASYGSSSAAVNAYDTTNHLYAYTVSGLNPGTLYQYRVVVGSQYSAGSFLTAPSATATTLKFVSYGDTRTNGATHNTVAGKVMSLIQSDPAYQTVLPFEGDAVTDGNTDSYWTSEFYNTSYANIRSELANVALLPIMGNHEGTGTLFQRYFPEPFVAGRYWSVDYGPAHFIMLDQYTSYTSGSAQYNWLKSDLAATTKKWKIIVLHEPGWTAGGGHTNNTTVQNVLEPLFEQYQVAMVLGGHNHYYARAVVNGVHHLTIGTGGAPVYAPDSGQPNIVSTYQGNGYSKFSISGSTLTGWFVDVNGTVRDTFTVTR